MLTEDIYFGGLKNPAGYRVCLMGNVEFFIRISWYNYPSAYIILLQAVRAEFELSTLLASAMSATQATDIHFKNNSNESSRFLLDNEHQDVMNVTPDTVLKGSIYLIMFNYLGPIRYKILLLLFFFIPCRPYIKSGSMPPKYLRHCRQYCL